MTESKFSYTGKLHGTELFTVRGDSLAEFKANLAGAVDAIAEATELQASRSRRVGQVAVTTQQDVVEVLQSQLGATVISETPTAPAAIEVIKDRYGNEWTYGHPDAPALPDGRGRYAKKKGVSKAGKAYTGWFDPAKGPKPFTPGATEAETIWLKG